MNRIICMLSLLLVSLAGVAQKSKTRPAAEQKIPMTADRWQFQPEKVQFLQYKSFPAMKIVARNTPVALKDVDLSSGTIEYDIEPQDPGFTGIYFRKQDSAECEYFYLRVGRAGNPLAIDAIQYAPIVKGVLLWDMLDYYQGPALFRKDEWNHVKLVISGAQMLVYVNDMVRPALEVARLEGDTRSGSIAFDGLCVIANLSIRPDRTEGLPPGEGFDPTHQDPRYLRSWKLGNAATFPPGQELTMKDLPAGNMTWDSIHAERRGLVNLTRRFGKTTGRRVVWLKVDLKAAAAQTRTVHFGFSDEAWVFINGKLLFADKNIYTAPIRKEPDGRCDLDNAGFQLPLQAGMNEVLVGVSNDFYGWGIIARLDTMEGIEVVE